MVSRHPALAVRQTVPGIDRGLPRKKLSGVGHGLATRSRPCRRRGSGGGLDLHFDCNIATISGRLGEGRELDIEAKLCELGDEAFGSHFLRAAIEMIGTEILELGAVLEHVVDGREQ
jgi:hypothetical protein